MNYKKLIPTLWKIFLVTFPFSLHFVLYEKASYRFGNFNPWVTGFLFLPQILLGIIFLLWFIDKLKRKDFKKFQWPTPAMWLLKLFVLNLGIVTFIFGDPILFLFFAIGIVSALIVYQMIRAEIIPHQEMIKWLLYGAAFQIVLAYLQTRINGSVGLPIIGEPAIGPEVLNVAKIDLPDGTKTIRPYGTFMHPNVLGAYLMAVLFIALPYLKRAAIPFWLIFMTAGIYLTGSQAAQITTLVVFALLFLLGMLRNPIQKRWLSLAVLGALVLFNAWFFVNSAALSFRATSIQERLDQNVISFNMFLNNFWGVGTGNFTLEMENYAPDKLMPWDFQPVHNGYFLTLNETGIQGFLLLIALIAWVLHNYWKEEHDYDLQDKARILPFASLMIIASFDHLIWTSYIGLILVGFVIAETTRTA